MSITLRPRENSGIPLIESTIDAINLIKGVNGYPITEKLYPINGDGVMLSMEPGVFDYTGVRRSYYAILDDFSYENVEKHVEKARKEYDAWLNCGEHVYNKEIPSERKYFMNSKELKNAFENVGFKFSNNEYVEFFNAYKHPTQKPEGKTGWFSKRYNKEENAEYKMVTDNIQKFIKVHNNAHVIRAALSVKPTILTKDLLTIMDEIQKIDIEDVDEILMFLSQFKDDNISTFYNLVIGFINEHDTKLMKNAEENTHEEETEEKQVKSTMASYLEKTFGFLKHAVADDSNVVIPNSTPTVKVTPVKAKPKTTATSTPERTIEANGAVATVRGIPTRTKGLTEQDTPEETHLNYLKSLFEDANVYDAIVDVKEHGEDSEHYIKLMGAVLNKSVSITDPTTGEATINVSAKESKTARHDIDTLISML